MSVADNEGAYPLAGGLVWHGGAHLLAPASLPVRAIADGTVVYARKSTERNSNKEDPLNYQAGAPISGWTSDGCVVIQHDTEIGEGANCEVRFFSIAMHLENIPSKLQKGKPIYRKDPIGEAGYINGIPDKIHFEIICDDENLSKLVGRVAGDLPTSISGRSDAVYGDVYFYLPIGTTIFDTNPQTAPQSSASMPTYITTEILYVGLKFFEHGYATTYLSDGTPIGEPLKDHDAEYEIYEKSIKTHIRCPSAAYELLRFGRVLGPDVLSPSDTPHWLRVRYPGGEGWINLSLASIGKFSDADFPHWRGWQLVDDSVQIDTRVNAKIIRSWFDRDGDTKITPEETRTGLANVALQKRLTRVICKIPTEWDESSIDRRWGWLKSGSPENEHPLSTGDYEELKKHIAKLCFWQDASISIDSNHWHFQPKEFIRQSKKCVWYTTSELARCMPRRTLAGNITWPVAQQRANMHKASLNLLFKKYLGENRARHIHALSQIYIETGLLQLMEEGGSGVGKNYGPFYGRGYMQLTWPANYENYGKFKNLPNQMQPIYLDPRITGNSVHAWSDGSTARQWAPKYDPTMLIRDLSHCAESAGVYWVSKRFRGKKNMNRACDLGVTPSSVGFISWLVNGGANGYSNRQQFAEYVRNILDDNPLIIGSATLRYPSLSPAGNPALCATFPPTEVSHNSNITVYYERQIP